MSRLLFFFWHFLDVRHFLIIYLWILCLLHGVLRSLIMFESIRSALLTASIITSNVATDTRYDRIFSVVVFVFSTPRSSPSFLISFFLLDTRISSTCFLSLSDIFQLSLWWTSSRRWIILLLRSVCPFQRRFRLLLLLLKGSFVLSVTVSRNSSNVLNVSVDIVSTQTWHIISVIVMRTWVEFTKFFFFSLHRIESFVTSWRFLHWRLFFFLHCLSW